MHSDNLLQIEKIKQLKAKYFRCLDTKDWVGLATLFAPNAVIDLRQDLPDGLFNGPTSFVHFVSQALREAVSVHHGHMPEIDITSSMEACGIWAMEDQVWWSGAGLKLPDGGTRLRLHGYGHYHETYRLSAERWMIQSMRLDRLHTSSE